MLQSYSPFILFPLWVTSFVYFFTAISFASPLNNRSPTHGPQPYTINVEPAVIEDIRVKARDFRNSIDTNAPAWFDGPPADEIESFATYWVDEYDWSTVQAEINANFSHFYTTVPPPGGQYNEPVDLHFIHERSDREDAIPILFLHGWPSTSLEWSKVIPSLVHPDSADDPAFHVVAPDIPGFGFSPALNGSRVGVSRYEYATIFASLMAQLGYSRYAVYSTDLGFPIALSLVVDYQHQIINHITDFYIVFVPDADLARFQANQTTPEESAYIASSLAWFATHSGYATMHSTYPLTLAYALNDSPVGFLAWIYHLAQSASDRQYTAEEIITLTLTLYLPGVYANIRSYKELYGETTFTPEKNFTVPTSILQFGGTSHYPEIEGLTFVPRDWIERNTNVTYFARETEGGHFPALTQPELVIGHIKAIFS